MTRPAALANSWWADFALVTVSLGLVDSWTPNGAEWDGATWDGSTWGESYLTPHTWLDVTPDVLSCDIDTGRNGVDDPGDVATCSVSLYDPEGQYAIAGTGRYAVGNLLKVTAEWRAGALHRHAFTGVINDASADGDLVAPSTSVKAVDLLGALVSTDDTAPLPAQSTTERIAELLGRASVPAELRDLADDSTASAARRFGRQPARCGPGCGCQFGRGHDSSHGRRDYPLPIRRVHVRTTATRRPDDRHRPRSDLPVGLDLTESGADVLNVYDWTTNDRDAPLNAAAIDPASVRRFGRHASVRTDLLNADRDQLRALVDSQIAWTSWSPERVDGCEVPVHDDQSAAAAAVQVGDLVAFSYTGSAPWANRQLVGGYAHHISPDGWTVTLRCYPAIEATQWDTGLWDVATWSLGALPVSAKVA